MFIIEGTTCALSAPLWGYLCDKVLSSNIVALIGALLSLAGFILIGPAPFVPLETSVSLSNPFRTPPNNLSVRLQQEFAISDRRFSGQRVRS